MSNPDSGSGDAESVAALLRELGAQVDTFSLDDVDDALASSPDRLAVAGGDGSLASVAAPAGRAGAELAVIPTGTANDFARELGIPSEVAAACELAVNGVRTRRLDLAWMEDRPFLNVASLGLPPAAAERASGLKDALGPLAYAVGAVRAGLAADPVGCAVRCDGEELFAGQAWQVTVACTGAFGAGASIDAHPADGRLDVVAIEAGSRLRLLRHAHGLRLGELEGQTGVHKIRCGACEIDLDGVEPFNVDGEVIASGSCGFEIEPQAVAVVVG